MQLQGAESALNLLQGDYLRLWEVRDEGQVVQHKLYHNVSLSPAVPLLSVTHCGGAKTCASRTATRNSVHR